MLRPLGPIAALLRAGVEPRHVPRELWNLGHHFLTPRLWRVWGG